MPGSIPATSHLDWLISTTAITVLSWSRATRDLLKSFGWGIRALHQLATATMVPFPRRLPHTISPLEGGVTSELVSGIRGSGPHFGILSPSLTRPRAHTRARGQRRKSRRCGPICRRGELVLEMKCWSLQVGFNVKAGVAGVWPAQTRQAPLVVFAPGASTASRCGRLLRA